MEELRILHIEDDEEYRRAVQSLESRLRRNLGLEVVIESEADFGRANEVLRNAYDIVILDIVDDAISLDDEENRNAGVSAYTKVRGWKFIPVVFLTGNPRHAPQPKTGLIEVVVKQTGWREELIDAICRIVETRIPALLKLMHDRVLDVTNNFMKEFVEDNWTYFTSPQEKDALAKMILRRLGAAFERESIVELVKALDPKAPTPELDPAVAHPTEHYVIPPITTFLTAGTLVREDGRIWCVVTPTCDLIKRNGKAKANRVLLAPLIPVEDTDPYRIWENRKELYEKYRQKPEHQQDEAKLRDLCDKANVAKERLKEILENRGSNERYVYLPKLLDVVPHGLLDLQMVQPFSYEDVEKMERIACLDSPFAEFLVARIARYFGRIGTPVPYSDKFFYELEKSPVSQVAASNQ